MPMQYRGLDYSWARPDLHCLHSKGARFVMRYGSRDASKNLSRPELDAILAAGMSCGVFWQEGKTQMTRGYDGGVTDARDARTLFDGLGLAGIPVYFACDYDPPSGDWPEIDAYLNGAASVIGRARTGGYGGHAFISREFDRGAIVWGCQTYAWSGSPTQWDSRAQLRQVQNDVTVCGGAIDWEEAWAADHGQWPRPASAQPAVEDDEDVYVLPPKDVSALSLEISLNGFHTTMGLSTDSGTYPGSTHVRAAFHAGQGAWHVIQVYSDPGHEKVVVRPPAPFDAVRLDRVDANPCTVIPNFA